MSESPLLSTRERGAIAESIVANHLRQQGYHILKQNLYTKFGEIDILAKEGDEFVCVEVRSRQRRRPNLPPEVSLSPLKYQHLVRSLLSLPFLHNRPTRIDLITVEHGVVRHHFKSIEPRGSAH